MSKKVINKSQYVEKVIKGHGILCRKRSQYTMLKKLIEKSQYSMLKKVIVQYFEKSDEKSH